MIFCPCPPCGRQGRPGQGFLAGFIEKPRGSAPRERDHRGGDHPVPSRTRQLSPPSPRVLQRKAAGGQGVALAEGAFLSAPREARGGGSPCGPLCVLGRGPECQPFDEGNDFGLYETPEQCTNVVLRAGDLAVLAPEDAHKPGCTLGFEPCHVRKIVVKVRA